MAVAVGIMGPACQKEQKAITLKFQAKNDHYQSKERVCDSASAIMGLMRITLQTGSVSFYSTISKISFTKFKEIALLNLYYEKLTYIV